MTGRGRRLSARLLDGDAPTKPKTAGSGGAWKVGLREDARGDLDAMRQRFSDDVLAGRAAIDLDPALVLDRVGSDRRGDWRERPEFAELRESIRAHGQDTPIEVWPLDPEWRPDPDRPEAADETQYELITGRRRRAVAEELGIRVKAILPPREADPRKRRWQVLLKRYRENNHRADLAPLERMTSIADMFAAWSEADGGGSIRKFANAVGIDPTFVSRCNRIAANLDRLAAEHADPYRLGYRDLEAWLAENASRHAPRRRGGGAAAQNGSVVVSGRTIHWKRQRRRLVVTFENVEEAPERERIEEWLAEIERSRPTSQS